MLRRKWKCKARLQGISNLLEHGDSASVLVHPSKLLKEYEDVFF